MNKFQALGLYTALLVATVGAVAQDSTADSSTIAHTAIGDYVAPVEDILIDSVSPSSSAPASGFYAGMGAGLATMDFDGESETFEDANIRAFMGYQLSQYFSVEAGVSSLPFDELLDAAHITGMDVSILAALPVTSKLSAYGRLGYWDWDLSTPYYGTYYDLLGGSDKLYGIGLEYKISPRLKIRLDATRYDVAGNAKVDTITSNVAYTF